MSDEVVVTIPLGERTVDQARLSNQKLETHAEGQLPDPSAKGIFYLRMEDKMQPVLDVLGGTKSMRAAGERYVPAEHGELEKIEGSSDTKYDRRIGRGVMFGALPQAIRRVCDRMFATPMTVGTEGEELTETRGLPEELAPIVKDADRLGTDIDQLGKDMAADASKWGMTHLLVDLPAERAANLAEAEALDIRPYFSHISGGAIFAVKYRRLRGGRMAVSQIRYRSDRVEQDGEDPFRETNTEQITAWNFHYGAALEGPGSQQPTDPTEKPGTVVKWNRDRNGNWVPETPRDHEIEGYNLVTCYFRKKARLESEPPFEDLAWTMTRWWVSTVEQCNNLHFARYEMRGLFGGDEKAFESFQRVGNTAFQVDDPMSKAERMGAPTAGIDAGWTELQRLEDQAVSEGLAPFTRSASPSKATDSVLGENRSMSEAQSWAGALSDALMEAFRLAALLASTPNRTVALPEKFRVKIHDDALVLIGNSENPRMILDAAREGLVDQRGFLDEFKRYGVLSRDFDSERAVTEGEPTMVRGGDMATGAGPMAITSAEGGPQAGRNAASGG